MRGSILRRNMRVIPAKQPTFNSSVQTSQKHNLRIISIRNRLKFNQIDSLGSKQERGNSFSSNTTNLEVGPESRGIVPNNITAPPEPDTEQHLQSIKEEAPQSNSGSLVSQGKHLIATVSENAEQLRQEEIVQLQSAQKPPREKTKESHEDDEEDDVASQNQNDDVQSEDQEEADDDGEDGEEFEIDYVQGELIQEGTRVYSALNVLNGQLLAVKIVPLNLEYEQYQLQEQDFDLAIDILDQLLEIEHENIHQIITYDTTKGPLTLAFTVVMPFESGGSIKWLLQKFNKFSPHLAAIFMKQILEGLAFLHSQGLTHQNLKTSNVLVDENANAKLSDVNILQQYDVSIYSAPECFEGGEYTAYADVWSAGCIFIEMLTQHNPWQYQYGEKVTFEEIQNHLQNGRLFSLSNIVLPDILQVLKIIFKKNPEERLTASQLLELEFFKQKIFETNEYKQSLFQAGQSQILGTYNQGNSIMLQSQQTGTLTGQSQLHGAMTKSKTLMRNSVIKPPHPHQLQRTHSGIQRQPDSMQVSQGLSKQSNSNSQKSISSQSKSSLKKNSTHQAKQMGILQKQGSILRKMMSRMHSVDEDLQSSIGLDDVEDHQLSYQDLRNVIIKKTTTAFNDIIEEEDVMGDDRIVVSPEVKFNPLVKMGIIRHVTASVDNMNPFGQQVQSLVSEDSEEFKKNSSRKFNNSKNFQFSLHNKTVHSSHSSSGSQRLSQMLSHKPKERSSFSIDHDDQILEAKKYMKQVKSTRFESKPETKPGAKHCIVLHSTKNQRPPVHHDNDHIVRQLVGDALANPPQQDNEMIFKLTGAGLSLEEMINKQYYQSGKSDISIEPKVQETDAQMLEDLINRQFYRSDISQKDEQPKLADTNDLANLEKMMNAQFYSNNNSPDRKDEMALLEEGIARQFFNSEVMVAEDPKEPADDSNRELHRLEQIIMDQYLGGFKIESQKDQEFTALELAINKQFYDDDEEASPNLIPNLDPLKELEKLMQQQYNLKTLDLSDYQKEDLVAKQSFGVAQPPEINSGLTMIPNVLSERNQSESNSPLPTAHFVRQTPEARKHNGRDEYIEYSFGHRLNTKQGTKEFLSKRSEDSIRSPLKLQDLIGEHNIFRVPEEDDNNSNRTQLKQGPMKSFQKIELEESSEILQRKRLNQKHTKKSVIVRKRSTKNVSGVPLDPLTNPSHVQNSIRFTYPEPIASRGLELALSSQIRDVISLQANLYAPGLQKGVSEDVQQTEQSESKGTESQFAESSNQLGSMEAPQPPSKSAEAGPGFFFQKPLFFQNLELLDQEWNHLTSPNDQDILMECFEFGIV